jgi:hypothetical protein
LSDENIKKEILGFELNNITENQDGVDEATVHLLIFQVYFVVRYFFFLKDFIIFQYSFGFVFILSERELKRKLFIFYFFLFHHFFKVFTQNKIFLF